MKIFQTILVLYLLAACFNAGCSSLPNLGEVTTGKESNIAEVSLNNGGGQLSYGYRFTFKSDGTALYEGSVPPARRGEKKPFGTFPAEKFEYRGRITADEFDALVKTIKANDFFSLKPDNNGYTDTPQTTTAVTLASGQRTEVHNQLDKGGAKLAAIESAILRTADQLKWEQEK